MGMCRVGGLGDGMECPMNNHVENYLETGSGVEAGGEEAMQAFIRILHLGIRVLRNGSHSSLGLCRRHRVDLSLYPC